MSGSKLIAAATRIAHACSVVEVADALREAARDLLGADGIAVIQRHGDLARHIAEDALSAEWTSQAFPLQNCLMGQAMRDAVTIVIPDIYADPRIAMEAYGGTFVRSLAATPIGAEAPSAALGVYWAKTGAPDDKAIELLEALAGAADEAMKNIESVAAARLNEETLHAVLESTSDCFYALDGDWKFVTFNRASEEYFRLSREDVLGRSIWELFPAGRDRTFGDNCRAAMNDRRHVQFESPSAFRPGNTVEIRMAPMAGGMSVALTDITERRRTEAELRRVLGELEARVAAAVAERETALRQLHETQKVEALGQITGGVAHDFNNLLSPILGGLEILQRRGVGDARAQRLIDGAMQAAERSRTLVQRLLAFARRQPLMPAAVDVSALVGDMRDLLTSTVGPRVRIVTEVATDTPFARADANQLELALLNLAVNARDAMPDGGVLTIQAGPAVSTGGALPVGDYVRLSVTDTGIGMDEATLARAVEPFFSTKGIGKGTGLGLSMAHGLAGQLGGGLDIASKPGFGTTITLLLPVSREAPGARSDKSGGATATSAGVVLLVDDEALVRATTAEMLADLGFDVVEAEAAPQAIALIEGGLAFDWIVTDHMMPGMTGADLARHAQRLRPGAKVLVISGYAEVDAIAPDLPRLAKPFRQDELAESLTLRAPPA